MLADKVFCIMFCHVSFSDKISQVSETAAGERQIVVSPFFTGAGVGPFQTILLELGLVLILQACTLVETSLASIKISFS